MNTFNQNKDQQFRNRIKNYDFEFDKNAWKDMEGLLEKKPPRIPKWYFNFNLFLIGVLSICLSCFFPVIIDEVAIPEKTEDKTNPVKTLLPKTTIPEQAPEKQTVPEIRKEGIPAEKHEGLPTNKPLAKPLNYAESKTIEEQNFNKKNNIILTKIEDIPFYSLQHDILKEESPANIVFFDKEAGQSFKQTTKEIINTHNNLITKETGFNQSINAFPAVAKINITALEENQNYSEKLNTEIELPKAKKVEFGAIAGAGIQITDQAFEKPVAAVSAGAYAYIPGKGRWGIKVETQVQYKFPVGNAATLTNTERAELDELYAAPTPTNNQESLQTAQNYDTDAKPTKLLVALPVMASYKLSSKTDLEAGLVASYRPQMQGNNQDKDLLQSSISSTTQANTALGFAIGVEQKLTKKVAVNVRYNRNITSPSSLKPDSSIMVSARYKF